MIFDPYPHRQFFTAIRQKIWHIFDPSPLKNADVLNGWSQSILKVFPLTGIPGKTPIQNKEYSIA